MKHLSMIGLAATLFFNALPADAEAEQLTASAGPDTMLGPEGPPAFTARHPQWGFRAAYGLDTGEELGGDVNPYAAGFGLTVGYTFRMNLYLGASVEYYLGSFENIINDEPRTNVYSAMFEPGYDLLVSGALLVRPQVGVGVSALHAEVCSVPVPADGSGSERCTEDTEYKLAVAPGAMLLIDDIGGVYGQLGLRYHHIFDAGRAGGVLFNIGFGAAF